MDTITFQIERDALIGMAALALVNGTHLASLAEAFELPRFKDASGYTGLPTADAVPPFTHFMGITNDTYTHDGGRVPVLGCGCGVPACWPLTCRKVVTEGHVVWSAFFLPFCAPESAAGEWSYAGFDPFTFERSQYEAALGAHASNETDHGTHAPQRQSCRITSAICPASGDANASTDGDSKQNPQLSWGFRGITCRHLRDRFFQPHWECWSTGPRQATRAV